MSSFTIPVNNENNSVLYSLHNVENYKPTLNYSIHEILNKYNLFILEYLKFITEKVNLKNSSSNKFIIIRGLETISHVFNNILYYSKNIDLAFFHGQKAFYFYVEFIEQISDEQHIFLKLNSRDASLFVYKKTLFEINNEYRKKMTNCIDEKTVEYFDILHIHTNIIKSIINFFIHKYDFFNDDIKIFVKNIIHKTENIINKISNCKLNKKWFGIILLFIEQLNKDIYLDELLNDYFNIIELFLKEKNKEKNKEKIDEITIEKKIYSLEFYENLNNYQKNPNKFIYWLFS